MVEYIRENAIIIERPLYKTTFSSSYTKDMMNIIKIDKVILEKLML